MFCVFFEKNDILLKLIISIDFSLLMRATNREYFTMVMAVLMAVMLSIIYHVRIG